MLVLQVQPSAPAVRVGIDARTGAFTVALTGQPPSTALSRTKAVF